MADETPKLRIHMIGMDVDPDDLPDGPMVVLTGDLDAVRAAGRLFGLPVTLVACEADHDQARTQPDVEGRVLAGGL